MSAPAVKISDDGSEPGDWWDNICNRHGWRSKQCTAVPAGRSAGRPGNLSEQERLHRFPAQGTHYQWRLEARGTATATRLGRTLRRQCHPVREALRWLESEGLLRYDAHKGSTVVQPEPGATREKYQIRAVLEGLATSLAAPKISDEDIRELESYNEQLADANRTPSQINDLNRTGSPRLLWRHFLAGCD